MISNYLLFELFGNTKNNINMVPREHDEFSEMRNSDYFESEWVKIKNTRMFLFVIVRYSPIEVCDTYVYLPCKAKQQERFNKKTQSPISEKVTWRELIFGEVVNDKLFEFEAVYPTLTEKQIKSELKKYEVTYSEVCNCDCEHEILYNYSHQIPDNIHIPQFKLSNLTGSKYFKSNVIFQGGKIVHDYMHYYTSNKFFDGLKLKGLMRDIEDKDY